MKIIDAHLHFVPENTYLQDNKVRKKNKNKKKDINIKIRRKT